MVLLTILTLIWLIYCKTSNEREHQITQYYPNGVLKTIHHYKGDVLMMSEVFDEKQELKIVSRYHRFRNNKRILEGEWHYCMNQNLGEDNYFTSNETKFLSIHSYYT